MIETLHRYPCYGVKCLILWWKMDNVEHRRKEFANKDSGCKNTSHNDESSTDGKMKEQRDEDKKAEKRGIYFFKVI